MLIAPSWSYYDTRQQTVLRYGDDTITLLTEWLHLLCRRRRLNSYCRYAECWHYGTQYGERERVTVIDIMP